MGKYWSAWTVGTECAERDSELHIAREESRNSRPVGNQHMGAAGNGCMIQACAKEGQREASTGAAESEHGAAGSEREGGW
jgi:hypothetical protein